MPPPPARPSEEEKDLTDHPWYFFELAITYLVRAFQTEGLDQLLWHMVAIEALVGEEPVRATIRRRLVRMLGSTESNRKEIRKQFNRLYDLRSDLVHGNPWGTPETRAEDRFLGSLPGRTRVLGSSPAADLANLRQLARRAILWFARWLDHEHRRVRPPGDPSLLPSRKQLLSVLDFDEQYENLSRHCQQIDDVVRALPPGFPNVSEWAK
jgi:hypothetical protein